MSGGIAPCILNFGTTGMHYNPVALPMIDYLTTLFQLDMLYNK